MPIQSTDIEVTTGDAFQFSGNYQTYTIKNNVVVATQDLTSPAAAIDTLNNNGTTYYSVIVGNYGTIASANFGIAFRSSSSTVNNYANGAIQAYVGIYTASTGNKINNKGTITGSYIAIQNDTASSSIVNSGYIIGSSYGIYSYGDGENIYNSGTIVGTGTSSSAGVYVSTAAAGQVATIRNSGTIGGDSASVSSFGAGAFKMTNTGSLEGDVRLTNTGGDTIINKGEIHGDVYLGNGTNTFDGRGGSVDGVIYGGSRSETFTLGNDGETVNGGAGHDVITGGSGADIFAFDSYAAANSDRIFGFDVSNDLIQLHRSTFTKLTAGVTPTFSVASAATSATDYLFYNSVSGGLFYDRDGSGSGAASLIATLDPGLKMTAADFKVV